ncbi:serine/threonine protein kinase [Conyzicola lurida]|uniref:non-specific serine/threonine protein kinase n=1 Tax=Conyzicola lurida TaxID=1172621 RepID=A0A841AI01_9MICO|nr:serine/threonine-protein kinase [Conyzicola lurida]MBB5842054.1 serine/threonine protein kinase [Conyzicola lurida]
MTPDDTVPYSRLNDRYQILSLIGSGGMASVYEARDEFLDRLVAVKLFDSNLGEIVDAANQEHELKMLARLNHHGLVTLIDAGIVENKNPALSRMFLVMELVSGPTLLSLTAQRALSGQEIAQLGFDLAESLQYIHANDVIHRDVKPANVLIVDYVENGDRPRAKLADFGIALVTGVVADPSETLGTAAYLSPEQAMRDVIEPSTDIYSLGLCLLECFTRELTFPGTQHVSAVARLISDPVIPDSLPKPWFDLLTAMTSREPGDRPTSAEVTAALGELIGFERDRANGRAIAPPVVVAPVETDPEVFDRIARIASRLLTASIVIIASHGGDDRLLAVHGIDPDSVDRLNVLADPQHGVSPLRRGVGAMARVHGALIRSDDGVPRAAFWVLDPQPLVLSAFDDQNLADMVALVAREVDRLPAPAPRRI